MNWIILSSLIEEFFQKRQKGTNRSGGINLARQSPLILLLRSIFRMKSLVRIFVNYRIQLPKNENHNIKKSHFFNARFIIQFENLFSGVRANTGYKMLILMRKFRKCHKEVHFDILSVWENRCWSWKSPFYLPGHLVEYVFHVMVRGLNLEIENCHRMMSVPNECLTHVATRRTQTYNTCKSFLFKFSRNYIRR